MHRKNKWLENTGWYIALIVFALVTALPFIWTGLMSMRQDSGNIFRNNRPPQLIPYPGVIGWGAGYETALSEGSYQVSEAEAAGSRRAGSWVNYGVDIATSIEGTALEGYMFPATTQNYYKVWADIDIVRYFMNSLYVTGSVVILNVITCSLAAYPLAKIKFKGRNTLFTIMLGTLVFPPQLIMIPLYVMMTRTLNIDNSHMSLILPFATSAFGIFMLRQIYQSIPDELIEAARIDGANEFTIWYRVLLPLIRPGIATLAIITFVNSWNDFLWPLLMLSDRNLFTLPLGLSFLRGFFSGNLRTVAAGIVLATVPMIIFFLVFQKQFVRGLSGAVKG